MKIKTKTKSHLKRVSIFLMKGFNQKNIKATTPQTINKSVYRLSQIK